MLVHVFDLILQYTIIYNNNILYYRPPIGETPICIEYYDEMQYEVIPFLQKDKIMGTVFPTFFVAECIPPWI